MAIKKRYVKRWIRKALFGLIAIATVSWLTTVIVEQRHKNDEPVTDFNGDPATLPFSLGHKAITPRRPRPPVQVREAEPEPDEFEVEPGKFDFTKMYSAEVAFRLPKVRGPQRDWNNYTMMEMERQRVGLGEQGVPAYIEDESQRELEKNMSMYNGFNALLSDSISINRSVPDVRKESCQKRLYLATLPSTSIVIPFYNEHFSVLLRSIYSIINRTPPELLKEIIIVDDFSDREELKEQLDDYIAEYLSIVKVVRLPARTGLIGARLAGARAASGDVLVFFDSHIECNYNWLPPLLEPIALNRNISTCPIVDIIDHANFAYNGGYQEGARGAFDWFMSYKNLPVLPVDIRDKTVAFRSPIMMGGLFAIGREFFWDIGGYDEQLDIWGGEQYELSFKIWMCGGMLLDVPCSRVAHIFRGPMEGRNSPRDYDFYAKNIKRIAEVWMDEYKEHIYRRQPEKFENLDYGDISEQQAVRERMQCKSFKWFLEVVAPDILKTFPPVQPPDYASGAVQNVAFPQFCLDTMNGGSNHAVGLHYCAENKTHPQNNQHWELSYGRDMRVHGKQECLDVHEFHENTTVWMWTCHNQGGNQFWYYDRAQQWLVHGRQGGFCMQAVRDNGGNMHVYANKCDPENLSMKWLFGFVNDTALDNFYKDLP